MQFYTRMAFFCFWLAKRNVPIWAEDHYFKSIENFFFVNYFSFFIINLLYSAYYEEPNPKGSTGQRALQTLISVDLPERLQSIGMVSNFNCQNF